MLETIKHMYFWLNCSGKNNDIERILAARKNIDSFFCMANELLESDEPHLLLLSDDKVNL